MSGIPPLQPETTGNAYADRMLSTLPQGTGTSASPPVNPYATRMLAELDGDEAEARAEAQSARFLASFRLASKVDPGIRGEAQRIAKQIGVDPRLAENNIEVARQVARERALRARNLAESSPQLHEQLQRFDFLSIAADDVDNLATTESAFGSFRRQWAAGRGSNSRGLIGVRKALGLADAADEEQLVEIDALTSEAQKDTSVTATATRVGGQMGDTAALSLGVGAGVSAVATPFAGVVAGGATSFVSTSALAAGNSYLDMRERGIPHDRAFTASGLAGIGIGALETLSNFVAVGPAIRVGSKLARQTSTRAFSQFVRDYAGAWATETLTEGVQERLQYAAEEAAAAGIAGVQPGESLSSRVDAATGEAAKAMLLLGIPGPAIGFASDVRRANRAQAEGKFFDTLAKQAAASEVRKRNPDQYAGFVDQVAEGSGVEAVFVDGKVFSDALRQGGLEQDFAEKAPDVARQVERAAAIGGDVAVPIGTYAAHVAGTDLGVALRPHVRLDPDSDSAAEAAGFRQGERDEAGKLQRDTEQRQAAETARRESARTVHDQFLGQIRATGRLRDTEARSAATLLSTFVETRAQQAGMQPHEFAARFPLTIAAAADEGGIGLRSPRGDFHPLRGIRLFEAADVSTLAHESGHWFFDTSVRLASQENAPAAVVQDVQNYLASVGVADVQTWNAMSLEQQRTAHERFSYGFEEYLATGKAPSVELQGLFSRFRAWLTRLYRNVRARLESQYEADVGEKLPALAPELTAFFDRMLASDAAIEQAQAVDALVPLFEQRPEGVSDAEWSEYQRAAEEARDAGAVDIDAASTRQAGWFLAARARVMRALGKEAEAVRGVLRAEVAEQVQREPVYRALAYIRTGTLIDTEGGPSQSIGGNTRLDTAAVKAMFPNVDLRKLNLTAPGGLQPDVAAKVFGYANGEAMVRAIMAAPPLEAAVDGRTDVRMLEEYGELVAPESIDEATAGALQNEARRRFVAVEQRLLAGAGRPVRALLQAARLAAGNILGGTTVRDIRPRQHRIAASRLQREARRMLKRGDGIGAARAHEQQLVQSELASQSREGQLEVERALRRFRMLFRDDSAVAKTRNVDIVSAARSVLAHFGLADSDLPPSAYVAKLAEYNPALLEQLQPVIDRASQGARDYRDLTLDEFRQLRDAIAALMHQAARERTVEVDGQRHDIAVVAAGLADDLRDIGLPTEVPGDRRSVTSRDEWVRDGMSATAASTRVEHWTRAISDRWTRFVWRPVRDALTNYRTDRNNYVQRLESLVKAHRDAGLLSTSEIAAPLLDYTFNGKAEVLGALLHSGNSSNLYKLLVGRQWGHERDNGSLDTSRWDRTVDKLVADGVLTQRDFDFVQSVWDLLEEVKPLSQRTHRALFGFYFEEIQAQPFARFGKNYRGGYVPAYADSFSVQSARLHEQMAELEGDYRNQIPATPRGHTKNRDGSARRLSLDVRRLSGHLDEVLRFAHVQPAIRDVLRTINHRDLKPTLERYNPVALEKLLLPWLTRAARGVVTEAGRNKRADRFWNALRRNGGLALMMGNLSNAAQNVTGLFVTLSRVPARYVLPAIFRETFSPGAVAAEIAEASPFMADRSSKSIFEALDGIRDAVKEATPLGKVQRFAQRHGYALQQLTQNYVDRITWLAARDQALAELGHLPADEAHREAVARADGIVRQTQSSLEAEDVSAFEVGTPFWKALVQFGGWFNSWANANGYEAARIVRELGWVKGAPQLFGLYAYGMALPMIAAAAIGKTLAGSWGDEDGDGISDEIVDVFFASQVKGALAAIPLLGQGGNLVWNVLATESSFDNRMPLPASLSLIEGGVRAVGGLGNGVSGREVRATSDLLTLLFGVPASLVGRPAGFLTDVASGRVEPTGPVDAVRGLVTGRASEASRR